MIASQRDTEDVAQVPNYSRPPIVEAVIAFDFEASVDFSEIARSAPTPPRGYDVRLEDTNFLANFDLEKATVEHHQEKIGLRFTTRDQTEILLVQRQRLLVSKLAPYTGWEALIGRFRRDFEWARDKLGVRKPSRIGLRYINRLDVPLFSDPFSYLNLSLNMPGRPAGPVDGFTVTSSSLLDEGVDHGGRLTTTAAVIISPVPNCYGLLVDVDAGFQKDLPLRMDATWPMLERLRDIKNQAFESLMTDRSRQLFS